MQFFTIVALIVILGTCLTFSIPSHSDNWI